MVAGGQPSGLSFDENVRKECEEEASLPPENLEHLEPTGEVSYRYTTPKGLSSATLVTYDLEMPPGLLPLCSDGEVRELLLSIPPLVSLDLVSLDSVSLALAVPCLGVPCLGVPCIGVT